MVELEVQRQSAEPDLPTDDDFQAWVEAALKGHRDDAEVVIRVVDSTEIQGLNSQYRHKDKPTNVLSFPSELPEIVASSLLGDIVICAAVVAQEAQAQGKPLMAHWAHMIVHGVLHLIGFDHISEQEAQQMERLECSILAMMGIADPYLIERTK